MTDPDLDDDAIVAMLEEAGLVELFVDEDGRDALRLTQRGTQLGRAMAMAGDDADARAVLDALLDQAGAEG